MALITHMRILPDVMVVNPKAAYYSPAVKIVK